MEGGSDVDFAGPSFPSPFSFPFPPIRSSMSRASGVRNSSFSVEPPKNWADWVERVGSRVGRTEEEVEGSAFVVEVDGEGEGEGEGEEERMNVCR